MKMLFIQTLENNVHPFFPFQVWSRLARGVVVCPPEISQGPDEVDGPAQARPVATPQEVIDLDEDAEVIIW